MLMFSESAADTGLDGCIQVHMNGLSGVVVARDSWRGEHTFWHSFAIAMPSSSSLRAAFSACITETSTAAEEESPLPACSGLSCSVISWKKLERSMQP